MAVPYPDYPGDAAVPNDPREDERLIVALTQQLATSRDAANEHVRAIDHHLQEKERHQRIGEACQAALEVLEPHTKVAPEGPASTWAQVDRLTD